MSEPFGIVAEFDTPGEVLDAARKAHHAGFRRLDAYAPYAVEGLSEAIGFKRTRVSLIVLIGGITGGLTGFGMQCYSAIISYPLNVGGRPFFSWPAFIPITFELTVLFAALAGFFGVLVLNGLPRPHHPIFNTPHFAERNSSHFYLCILAEDSSYPAASDFLAKFKPTGLWEVEK